LYCIGLKSIDRYIDILLTTITNNNCKLKQYSGRLPEGIHHQITIRNRQKTDKGHYTKDKKEKEGQRELEHRHN